MSKKKQSKPPDMPFEDVVARLLKPVGQSVKDGKSLKDKAGKAKEKRF